MPPAPRRDEARAARPAPRKWPGADIRARCNTASSNSGPMTQAQSAPCTSGLPACKPRRKTSRATPGTAMSSRRSSWAWSRAPAAVSWRTISCKKRGLPPDFDRTACGISGGSSNPVTSKTYCSTSGCFRPESSIRSHGPSRVKALHHASVLRGATLRAVATTRTDIRDSSAARKTSRSARPHPPNAHRQARSAARPIVRNARADG